MEFDVGKMAEGMGKAFVTVLGGKAKVVLPFAQAEAKKMAETLYLLVKLKESGELSKEQVELHLEMQKNYTRSVFMTVEGIGLLAVEAAINAALQVVKDTVNKAIGFALI